MSLGGVRELGRDSQEIREEDEKDQQKEPKKEPKSKKETHRMSRRHQNQRAAEFAASSQKSSRGGTLFGKHFFFRFWLKKAKLAGFHISINFYNFIFSIFKSTDRNMLDCTGDCEGP